MKDKFSEILSAQRVLTASDIEFLNSLQKEHAWFAMPKLLQLRSVKLGSEKYIEIVDSLELELLACSYYELLKVKLKEVSVEPLVGPICSNIDAEYENKDNIESEDDIIDSFIKKKITRLVRDDNVKSIEFTHDEEDFVLMEDVADFLYLHGEFEQAIEIYCRLSQCIPEKNTYFVSLIKDIEEKYTI